MGQLKFKRQVNAPSFNAIQTFTSTAAILANQLVRTGTAVGTVKPTTGSSGSMPFGVALNAATGAGLPVEVQLLGIVTVKGSTRAITRGAPVRATSGAASATVGGTVRTATGTSAQNTFGLALTSRAASTAGGTVSVLIDRSLPDPLRV